MYLSLDQGTVSYIIHIYIYMTHYTQKYMIRFFFFINILIVNCQRFVDSPSGAEASREGACQSYHRRPC